MTWNLVINFSVCNRCVFARILARKYNTILTDIKYKTLKIKNSGRNFLFESDNNNFKNCTWRGVVFNNFAENTYRFQTNFITKNKSFSDSLSNDIGSEIYDNKTRIVKKKIRKKKIKLNKVVFPKLDFKKNKYRSSSSIVYDDSDEFNLCSDLNDRTKNNVKINFVIGSNNNLYFKDNKIKNKKIKKSIKFNLIFNGKNRTNKNNEDWLEMIDLSIKYLDNNQNRSNKRKAYEIAKENTCMNYGFKTYEIAKENNCINYGFENDFLNNNFQKKYVSIESLSIDSYIDSNTCDNYLADDENVNIKKVNKKANRFSYNNLGTSIFHYCSDRRNICNMLNIFCEPYRKLNSSKLNERNLNKPINEIISSNKISFSQLNVESHPSKSHLSLKQIRQIKILSGFLLYIFLASAFSFAMTIYQIYSLFGIFGEFSNVTKIPFVKWLLFESIGRFIEVGFIFSISYSLHVYCNKSNNLKRKISQYKKKNEKDKLRNTQNVSWKKINDNE